MDNRIPEQSPNNNLTALLQYHLKKQGMTAGALADECGIARSTVSRLVKGKGNRGNKYTPSLSTLQAMCRVLRLNVQESDELFCAAYPEFYIWRIANQKNLTLEQTEHLLYENGCPTFLRKP